MSSYSRWGILWRSDNRLDGRRRHLVGDATLTVPMRLFRTRGEAREYIKSEYGYIAERPDLRTEPHGWKMPIVVKVCVTVCE